MVGDTGGVFLKACENTWREPHEPGMRMKETAGKYNLAIIGGGSAGLMVAAGAAGMGARVALVEQGPMGGDCLNHGCVPSKALLHEARLAAFSRRLAGGVPAPTSENDWTRAAARVREAVETIAPHDSVERFQSLGVDVFQGRGKLAGNSAVEVSLNDGGRKTIRAHSIVLAMGSSPLLPPVEGLAEAGCLTNETVFAMPELPRRVAVLGGGPIGAELGQALARLGAQVTIIEMLPHLLPREDEDAAAVVADSLRRDGITLHTGTMVSRIETAGNLRRIFCLAGAGNGREKKELALETDAILAAFGRKPNSGGAGLEEAGMEMHRGFIRVDKHMRTSLKNVFACGDITGPYLFTHTANQQARVVIQNALLPVKASFNDRVIPWCTFTEPELARVGLNETQAREQGLPHRVLRIPFSGIDRAVCERDTGGFLKVLTPPGRDDILGATLVGAHAGELIHEIVLAMSAGIRLSTLANTIHIYPTRAEVFRRAGDESRKASFTPRLRGILGAYLKWRRR